MMRRGRNIEGFVWGNFGEKVFPKNPQFPQQYFLFQFLRSYGMFSHNKLEKLVLNVFESFGDFGEKLRGGYPPPEFGKNH